MRRQLLQYHADFGCAFIPNLKTRVDHEGGGYLVSVNSSGFRSDREFLPTKTPGMFRVLAFGDSFTAADGVSNKDRYTDILEKLLPGLEVYNFGLPGTGTDQHFLVFREKAPQIEHDLVLIAVQVENIRRVTARFRPCRSGDGIREVYAKPYFTLEPNGVLTRHHFPVPTDPDLIYKLSSREISTALAHEGKPDSFLPEYDQPDDLNWQLMRAILIQWIHESRVPVLVCPIPLVEFITNEASSEAYMACFQELGKITCATIHDPLPDYHSMPSSERWRFLFPTDRHPTRASHHLLAESLAPLIRSFMKRSKSNDG